MAANNDSKINKLLRMADTARDEITELKKQPVARVRKEKAPARRAGRPAKAYAPEDRTRYTVKRDSRLSLNQVTKLLNISNLTAYRWLNDGRFTGVEWDGRRWLFDPEFRIINRDRFSDEVHRRMIDDPVRKAN